MFYTELKISIKRSAEEIFEFLSDIHNETQWYPFTTKINGPIGISKKGRQYTRNSISGLLSGISQIEILSCEPPRLFSYRETSNTGRSVMSYALQEISDHTMVTVKISISSRHSVNHQMERLMSSYMIGQINGALQNLKGVLET